MFGKLFGRKSSIVGSAISQNVVGSEISKARDYRVYAQEGYLQNIMANACCRLLAGSVASVPWGIFKGETQLKNHPALDILAQPNASEGGGDFLLKLISFYLITGNSYVEAQRYGNQPPTELWTLRPDRMTVIAGAYGMPKAFRYKANGATIEFPADPITGLSNVFHWRGFHPTNDWYGSGPLDPAGFSVDQHNAAAAHNFSLLKNGGRPSSLINIKGNVNPDQFDRLKVEMDERFSGKNNGKPFLMTGEMQYQATGLSPAEMEYLEGKLDLARDICTGFGVPHILMIPGSATYNNIIESRAMMWEDTIIPLLCQIRDNLLGRWLLPMYGTSNVKARFNIDMIPALAVRRAAHSQSIIGQYADGLITLNEARKDLGRPDRPNGDMLKTESAAADAQALAAAAPPDPIPGAAVKTTQPGEKRSAGDNIQYVTTEIDDPAITASYTDKFRTLLNTLLAQFGAETLAEMGESAAFVIEQEVRHYIETHAGTMIKGVNDYTRQLVQKVLSDAREEADPVAAASDGISSIFDGFASYRVDRIAITETTDVTGVASLSAIKQSGVKKVEWLATLDSHTRDTHAELNGQVVEVGQRFVSSSGDSAERPGGFATAAENISCRCAIAAAFDDEQRARTPDESREIYNARDKLRVNAEKRVRQLFAEMFMIQKRALLKRLEEVTR